MRKLKKQIATRQRRLYAIHQHVSNKMQHSYEDYGPTSSPPSPFQITQWNKQFRQKAKKPLKDLMRLKRLITSNPSEPAVDMPYPSRNQKLPRRLCLPVMKGLLAVLLSSQGACSVDFFVLICKCYCRKNISGVW
ncbi:Hypothetical predicted protein [Paramuricea clavata]|uniref:Uncharacterized protein n=1 Tax=Paramuricea clavata TaxID=317549 RepID=A0A7D9J3F3_PARCT|nr:Hypothetical predicted protein [Paramuricea clavata]